MYLEKKLLNNLNIKEGSYEENHIFNQHIKSRLWSS